MEVTDIVHLFSRKTSILKNISKDCTILIFQFTYNFCTICNKCVYGNNKCKECNKYYCKYHYATNTSLHGGICSKCYTNCIEHYDNYTKRENLFVCIKNGCKKYAKYGYKDIMCYCRTHSKGKKVIDYYSTCFMKNCGLPATHVNKNPTTIKVCNEHAIDKKSFLYVDYKSKKDPLYQCSICTVSCNVVYNCLCSQLCTECAYLNTWFISDKFMCALVCGNCNIINMHAIIYDIGILYCNKCNEPANYISTHKLPYVIRCYKHVTALCIKILYKCSKQECYAKGYIRNNGIYCYTHFRESITKS